MITSLIIGTALAAPQPEFEPPQQMELDTLGEMIYLSRAIITAEVVSAETQASARGIWTTYTVTVNETLYGFIDAEQISFTAPGGKLGNVEWDLEGVPLWEPGAQIALFLPETKRVLPVGMLTVVDDGRLLYEGRIEDVPEHLDDLKRVIREDFTD